MTGFSRSIKQVFFDVELFHSNSSNYLKIIFSNGVLDEIVVIIKIFDLSFSQWAVNSFQKYYREIFFHVCSQTNTTTFISFPKNIFIIILSPLGIPQSINRVRIIIWSDCGDPSSIENFLYLFILKIFNHLKRFS